MQRKFHDVYRIKFFLLTRADNLPHSQEMPCNVLAPFIYVGNLEMIWTEFIGSNFIIVMLNTKQLLAQHIPLRLYMASLSLGASIFLHRTRLGGVVIPLMDNHLCGFLAAAEVPYTVEHSASCRCFIYLFIC